MPITRAKKETIVKKLSEVVKSTPSMVFVNFHGLSVADTNELRQTLRQRDVEYFVTRKTLIRRALLDAAKGELPELPGEVALAYGAAGEESDPAVPANSIAEFAKKHKDNLTILGGIFEGVFKSKTEMEEIASIPPLETLRGMFVNVINSPIAGFAVALHAIAEKKH